MVDITQRPIVGIDVESIAEVADALARHGSRYTDRLFTAAEVAASGGLVPAAAPSLTVRFAAKEAVLKLLRPDAVVPGWRSIEVCTAEDGTPSIRLHGDAADLAERRRIGSISVSLSHGAGIGTATVVAMTTA